MPVLALAISRLLAFFASLSVGLTSRDFLRSSIALSRFSFIALESASVSEALALLILTSEPKNPAFKSARFLASIFA